MPFDWKWHPLVLAAVVFCDRWSPYSSGRLDRFYCSLLIVLLHEFSTGAFLHYITIEQTTMHSTSMCSPFILHVLISLGIGG